MEWAGGVLMILWIVVVFSIPIALWRIMRAVERIADHAELLTAGRGEADRT